MKKMFVRLFTFTILATLTFCTKNKNPEGAAAGLTGEIHVDGSSTVFPITEAIAEEFKKVAPEVKLSVGMSGTGGGFKKFAVGEIDISNASRPIKAAEAEKAQAANIAYVEYPVAYDGLSIIVNPKNDWAQDITVEELKKLWEPESKVKTWADLRPTWPKRPIKLYGPGTDSGTFDYFTEAINGEAGKSRSDYTMSEDDNVLVKGVEGDLDALGYFGYAYYVEDKALLKVLAVNPGTGAVLPSDETIKNGTYKPLSRPLYIYVSEASLKNKIQVKEFVRFYLEKASQIMHEVGYVALPTEQYTQHLSSELLKVNAR